MPMKCIVRACVGASFALWLPVSFAAAQGSLERNLLGLGAAILLKTMQDDPQAEPDPSQGRSVPSQPATEPRTASSPMPSAPRYDAAQQEAMELQRNLNDLGFDAGPVDGLPGARTRAAVEAYQVSRGFPATGSLDPMQKVALEAEAARGRNGGVAGAADILEAQTYLRELGYDAGVPDGVWGPQSQRALDAFRRDVGLIGGVALGPRDSMALYQRVHGLAPVNTRTAIWNAGADGATGATAPAGPSFDCASASAPAERAICGNPVLASYDRQLAEAWRQASQRGAASGALLSGQQRWLAQRNACGWNENCIESLTRSRIVELGGSPSLPVGESAGGGFAAAGLGAAVFAATAAPPAAPDDDAAAAGVDSWIHVEGGRFIVAPDDFERRLSLLNARLDPSLLQSDDPVMAFMMQDEATRTGAGPHEIMKEFRSLNALEQADRIARKRAELIAEAQALPEITRERPLRFAFYMPVRPGEHLPEQGLAMSSGSTANLSARGQRYPFSEIVVEVDLQEAERIPLSREEAKAFLDRERTEREAGRTLVKVVWGRLVRLGADETIASFASPAAGRRIPTTFLAEKATLHYHSGNSRYDPDPVEPGQAIHVWDLGGAKPEPPSGARDALSLARELGLQIEDGHVVLDHQGYGARGGGDGAAEFFALSMIGHDPAFLEEGDRFAAAAALLLPEAQRRAFFGGRNVDHYGAVAVRMLASDSDSMFMVGDLFADEFARREAKTAFLQNHYPALLARTPKWPLPVLAKMSVSLGPYDFDQQSFPLQLPQASVFRVVSFPILQPGRGGLVATLASADRFGNLPERIYLPPERAQALKRAVQNDRLVLAWWADFDFGADGSEIEERFNAAGQGGRDDHRLQRPGRAQLKRIGLFADESLSVPVLQLDPAALLLPVPEPEAAPTPEQAPPDLAHLGSLPRATGLQVAGALARAMGGGRADYVRIAEVNGDVTSANEFDRAGAIETAIKEMQAQPEGKMWMEGQAQLDRYDLEAGAFAFKGGSGYVRFGPVRDRAWPEIPIQLIGPNPFETLKVDEAAARQIVESENRRVGFLIEIEPLSAEEQNRGGFGVQLVARPSRILFYRYDESRNEPSEIIASISYAEENAARDERLARRFEPTDFPDLADARPELTPHLMDLLMVRASGRPPSGKALDDMILAAWAQENGGPELPGARFFAPEEPAPSGPTAAVLAPAFASYMEAKAEALGDRFAVTLSMGRSAPPCGAFARLGGMYGDREILKALPLLQDDAMALNRRIHEEAGPFAVNRTYGFVQQRPSARHDGRCGSWFGIVMIENAMHEGKSGAEAAGVRLEFEVAEVALFQGPSDVPELLVKGRAEATRLVSADGAVGAPLVAAPPPPQPEPEPEATRTAAAAPMSAQATSTVQPQPAPAPEEKEAWPALTDLEVEPSPHDLLGLRTGQSMAEADRILRERGGLVAAYETPSSDVAGGGAPALAYRRVYISRDGSEAFFLGSHGPEGPVLALMRRMVLEKGALPYDRIRRALAEKYGKPDVEGDPTGMGRSLGWVERAGTGQVEACAAIPYSGTTISRWRRIDGIGDDGWQPSRAVRPPWLMGLPDYADDMLTYAGACNRTLVYIEESPQVFGASGFSVLMADLDAIRRADLAIAGIPSAEEIEIKF